MGKGPGDILLILSVGFEDLVEMALVLFQCIQVPAADSPCFESVQEDRDYCSLTNHGLYAGCEAQTLKKKIPWTDCWFTDGDVHFYHGHLTPLRAGS